MKNIHISSSSAFLPTQSTTALGGLEAGDKRRPSPMDQQHASSEAIRKHAVTALATSISRPEHVKALKVG
eukprot:CAMPEP_0201702924 /NCGR_PEP_ID=MMETSP0578-20130828/38140_1 /ASSEMBLY_ACC=CAM_ASM_000663 /TAXON_ID=267565 /ORGANISM="Skeletonema grethea, Strain CCMP 1804" /LENGTH=69 /DNA_ID=CAMNT_0048190603 /DNA_START=27 /DNA_END=233 /DNA_ORIENTATION=-